ncbi:hypothetical protein GCM10011492_17820 [Flexivirga endophytica]|uniref:Uncharacterized protein n=1 Tax=Flexivirga endophytica TaxID=1849103 RepID=A0A916T2U9_9MICO|nr:hypothetical protein [Flexivirga endophytica]GGB28008.1 hypothetical protein GCM10011492_17820 [Flexivirga endophytica]GHB61850.1 hypothetical protein GCM10008112_33510 [Flexivirga endophytica]
MRWYWGTLLALHDMKIHGVRHLQHRGWQRAVTVDTSETTKSFDGTPDPEAHIFSFELVRHDSSQPWRIIDFGEG